MTAAAETPASGPTGPRAIDRVVDWELAVRAAGAVARPGPVVTRQEAVQVVADLRTAADRAVPHVAEVARMAGPPAPPAVVVDRPGWARVNVAGFRGVLAPVVEESLDKRERKPSPAVMAIGARVTGAEVGSLLGVLSTRVLGQYDAFGEGSRMLLVAPNVVQVERELEVEPADFRLWVCLHEETHRVQFGANPWLAEHLLGRVRSLVGGLMADPSQVMDRLAHALRGLPDLVRGTGSGAPLLDAIQTPAEREQLAAITAVMSLLEGHADVVMDAVGPDVVPSVETIRARFARRRAGRGAVDQLLRRLLGLDAKARQYTDGARFVREVQERVGVDGFNAVWTSPETLPRPAEIAEPAGWVARVHG
jgi:coenzyme F420 biosynthesis associated uncharacterized protein